MWIHNSNNNNNTPNRTFRERTFSPFRQLVVGIYLLHNDKHTHTHTHLCFTLSNGPLIKVLIDVAHQVDWREK